MTSASFSCATPPPFTNITSVSSPEFTSYYVTQPLPGDTDGVVGPNGGNIIHQTWRNALNSGGNGIDNFSMEFMKHTLLGNLESVAKVPIGPTDGSTFFAYTGTSITSGTYQIRVNYTNVFQDGLISPGNPVSYLSGIFFILGSGSDSCDGVPGPGSSVNPGPGSNNSTGSGNGTGSSNSTGSSATIAYRPHSLLSFLLTGGAVAAAVL